MRLLLRCTLLALSASASLACASCSNGGATSCPNDLPATCVTPIPSYKDEIAAIVQTRCVSCHGATGVEAKRSLDTYAKLYALRTSVLNQVYACRMPLDGSLTDAERARLLEWLVCHAPNN